MSKIGQKIRHFRLVHQLAKGGMGDVYAAYDERLQRKVALKALREEFRPNAEVKARLLREARILSQLDHPNICRIYDLLEEEDSDVLVLELIAGESLKRALEKQKLGDSKRNGTKLLNEQQKTSIATQVCSALAAAHGQGVIHRDLKPDNVMLTPAGEVKILDFGLSRHLKEETTVTLGGPRDLTDPDDATSWRREERYRRLRTQLGSIMGTVAYMSPEQAQGEAAIAASDIYSLGLILHELFTGESPYEPDQSLAMMLSKVAKAETLPAEGIDGDLAALIERMKAMEPAARPSAIDVSERLRWIAEKPRRRRRKTVRALAMTFLVVVALALGLQAERIGREAARANREAARASQEAEAARQVSEFLVDLFELSDPQRTRGDTVTAREILDDGADRVAIELVDQPAIQARLMDTIGTVYSKLGLFDRAAPLLEQSLATRRDLLGVDHVETAESQAHLAYLFWQQGKFEQAVPLYEQSIATRERLLGPTHAALADSLNGLGIALWNLGKYAAAEPIYQRALAIRENALGKEHPKVAASLDNLAILFKDQQRPGDAEPLYRRSLQIREQKLGADHPQVASSLNNLGVLYMDQKRFEEAKPLYERAVAIWERTMGPDHPAVGVGLVNLATIHNELGLRNEARELYARCLSLFERSVGPEHPFAAYALAGQGTVLFKEGRYAEAEAPLQRALKILEIAVGSEHVDVGYRLKELARVYDRLGDTARAQQYWARARPILERSLGADHPEVAGGL
ncbi:MAG: serine/threonine-protein kinase [Acidobacteriota bacterium]